MGHVDVFLVVHWESKSRERERGGRTDMKQTAKTRQQFYVLMSSDGSSGGRQCEGLRNDRGMIEGTKGEASKKIQDKKNQAGSRKAEKGKQWDL